MSLRARRHGILSRLHLTITTSADLTQPSWASTVIMTNLSTSASDTANTAAFASYVTNAAPYTKLVFPTTGNFNFSDNRDITTPNIGVFGATNDPTQTVMVNTNPNLGGYRVLAGASNHFIKGFTVSSALHRGSTGRGSQNEQGQGTLLVEQNVDGFQAEDCVFDSAVAASAFFYGCTNYKLNRCIASNSLADGFHSTNGAHGGVFTYCHANNTGDDGFAAVQYGSDLAAQISYNLSYDHCYVLNGAARGFSAICCHDITYTNIYATNTYSPGVYIGREGGNTSANAVSNIAVTNAILKNCCTGTDQGNNGAFFLLNSDNLGSVNSVTATNVAIVDTPATNNGCVRSLTYGSGVIAAALDSFSFYGTTPSTYGSPWVYQNVAGSQSAIMITNWAGLASLPNNNWTATVQAGSAAPVAP